MLNESSQHSQTEIAEKEQKLETLQSKVSELKKCSQSPETPAKLQVNYGHYPSEWLLVASGVIKLCLQKNPVLLPTVSATSLLTVTALGVGERPEEEDQYGAEAARAGQRKPIGLQLPKQTARRLHFPDVCMA